MPYDVDIEVKVDGFIKDLDDFRKHLRRNAQFSLDRELNLDVEEIKMQLITTLNREIRVSSQVQSTTGQSVNIPEPLNIPKAKNDVIKEVFGQDIKNSEVFKKGATLDDTSSVFVVRNNRVKAWQSVMDSSTYAEQESKFLERLREGIVIDAKTGKAYKVNPDTVRGLKLECSRDTGQTIDSEKKFEAYKNSPYVDRRKYDGPYNRTAVWTIRQEDVEQMMKDAIPLDDIVELIQEGEYETARNVLQQHNKNGAMETYIERLQEIEVDGPTTTDFSAYKAIREIINNLKIRKEVRDATGVQGTVKYVLFTRYDRTDSEQEQDFYKELKIQVWLWMAQNEHKWFTVMVKAIEKAIMKYDSKAKFTD
jgi:hypothetical protein